MAKIPIPSPKSSSSANKPRTILELDRFSEKNLKQWESASEDLNRLESILYFGLEPERRSKREQLLAALNSHAGISVDLSDWVRIVTYQFSDQPLSSAGSLHSYGGRFNAGCDLDDNTLNPWPALYVAENYETAFREKFQLAHDGKIDGLSASELALENGVSHATLFLQGRIMKAFDLTSKESLVSIAKVLSKIHLPDDAKKIMKRLKIPQNGLTMIRTAKQLFDLATEANWTVNPVQFGLPAQSHILAELIRAAGFEAVLYKSTKGIGKCLAIFPEKMSEGSFVELRDTSKPGVTQVKLDSNTSGQLSGWHTLPASFGSS